MGATLSMLIVNFQFGSKISVFSLWGRLTHDLHVINSSLIWPAGYKSSWHEKITGSLFFICDVLDDGDSGPIFKVQTVYPPPHQRPQLRAEDICCTGFQDLVHEVAQ